MVSMVVAAAMSVVAWRATREGRQRSEARIAALAQAIHQSDRIEERPGDDAVASAAAERMFAGTASHSPGSRWGLAVAAGAFVIASLAAAAIVFSGSSPSAATADDIPNPQPAAAATTPAAPLELVALSHEREGDQLTVRGIVRNPAAGTEMDRVTAVVFLFDRDGAFLTSSRAALTASALIPGGESTFVVTAPSAGDVGRYRVSFRTDDRIVPHIDKRSVS
jgi:hypothetical protein